MLRHVLKSVPGFRPLEAIHVKSKDPVTRSGPVIGGSLSLSSAFSISQGKQSSRTMDVDGTPSVRFTTASSEMVTLESLSPYMREFEVGS